MIIGSRRREGRAPAGARLPLWDRIFWASSKPQRTPISWLQSSADSAPQRSVSQRGSRAPAGRRSPQSVLDSVALRTESMKAWVAPGTARFPLRRQ